MTGGVRASVDGWAHLSVLPGVYSQLLHTRKESRAIDAHSRSGSIRTTNPALGFRTSEAATALTMWPELVSALTFWSRSFEMAAPPRRSSKPTRRSGLSQGFTAPLHLWFRPFRHLASQLSSPVYPDVSARARVRATAAVRPKWRGWVTEEPLRELTPGSKKSEASDLRASAARILLPGLA